VAAKGARARAFAPLAVMKPTYETIPRTLWNVFVDHSQTATTQDTAHFLQDDANISRVVQHAPRRTNYP